MNPNGFQRQQLSGLFLLLAFILHFPWPRRAEHPRASDVRAALKTRIKSRSTATGLPKAVRDLLQSTAHSMDVSVEVWNGPGRASDRLNLSSACSECESRNPRLFDRCRKRRSYLSRQEAPAPVALSEACPAKLRLTRLAPEEPRGGPVLFAFGYEMEPGEEGRDADVRSFLEDMQTMLREPLENLPQLESLSLARGSQADRLPLLQIHSNERTTDAPNWNQGVLEQWCRVLQADIALAWFQDHGIVATSLQDSVGALHGNVQESLTLFAERQGLELQQSEEPSALTELPTRHPLAVQLGGSVHAYSIALRIDGQKCGMLCGLRRTAFAAYTEVEGLLIQSLANEMSLKWSNAELVQGLNRFLINTVKTLVSAIDAKDSYTSGHSERVNIISMLLGNELDLDLVDLESLYWSALLHDVGKIGLPESILNKPSPLETDEFALVQAHPENGWRMLHAVPELARAAEGIRHHHERWDGSGYPQGLAGEDIPILARIICVADAFDAIVSNRSYRKGQSPTRAVELIEECVGGQFDPEVVAALRRMLPLLEKHRWVLMSGKKTSFRY